MAKEFAKAFYNGKQWKMCRSSYIAKRIKIDGGMCEAERLGLDKCTEQGYIIHHIIWITPSNIQDVNITLNWNNLSYLCKKCHDKVHDVFQENKRAIMFDCDGRVVPNRR